MQVWWRGSTDVTSAGGAPCIGMADVWRRAFSRRVFLRRAFSQPPCALCVVCWCAARLAAIPTT